MPVFPELLPLGAALTHTVTREKPGLSHRGPPKLEPLPPSHPMPYQKVSEPWGKLRPHMPGFLVFFPPFYSLLCLLDWLSSECPVTEC